MTSFIVIAYNEAGNIETTLESILAQCADGDEVIVIDDGSTDGTAEIVARWARVEPRLRVVTLETNHGRGYARARGVEEARGEFLATVDADITLPRNWLQRCLVAIDGADAVGGTAVPDGDSALVHARVGLNPRVVAHRTSVSGSNGLFRRETLRRVSFDPSLREGEDVALGHALQQAGLRARAVEGLRVMHREDKGLSEAVAWMFASGRGASRQLNRYRQIRGPDLAFLGWLLAWSTGAVRLARGRRVALLLPIIYTAAAAAAHVRAGFELRGAAPARIVAGVGLDFLQLSAYFAGRLAGVVKR